MQLDAGLKAHLEQLLQERYEMSNQFRRLRDELYIMRRDLAALDKEIAYLRKQLRAFNEIRIRRDR